MEPPSISATLFFLLISFALVLLNAFFVASEFAIVKVRRTRLEELAGKGVSAARVSLLCVDQLDEYLSATQLGITLVSLALGWIGEESFYHLLLLVFPQVFGGEESVGHLVATGISFFIITMLHVVLGELVPKSMAIQKAEVITLRIALPLRWFYRLAKPLIHAFTAIANLILARLGFDGSEEPALSEDELKIVMKESHEEGVISESEAQIITKAFSFSDKRIRDIMIPAEKMLAISLAKPFHENVASAREKMHTRLPLLQEGLNTVVGIVHMKDVLHQSKGEQDNSLFQKVARPALFVDPSMRQDQLMKVLKERRAHLAIVQDPKSKETLGLVTMEDILEELVGDIADEHGN